MCVDISHYHRSFVQHDTYHHEVSAPVRGQDGRYVLEGPIGPTRVSMSHFRFVDGARKEITARPRQKAPSDSMKLLVVCHFVVVNMRIL
ncbi:hypothetical protein PC128_g25762 [Phytophthora cactorum]|nr:hypothetical protein PC128_g25762 [Phytophthora cactorum]